MENLNTVHPHDIKFVEQHIAPFSHHDKKRLMEEYALKPTRRERNLHILSTFNGINEALNGQLHWLGNSLGEEDLRSEARRLADQASKVIAEYGTNPLLTYNIINSEAAKRNIKSPLVKENYSPCFKRFKCERWWLRNLRKCQVKAIEATRIHFNDVNRLKGIYCSNELLAKRASQKFRNRNTLENMVATNDLEQSYSLSELSDLSVSNPAIRKAELMVRMRGFENEAKENGHVGLFLTFTCPSKYHRAYSLSGQPNDKWSKLLPSNGQQYLCNVWKKIRAKLNREGIRIYGFRVAEPQHDGTPHWHLMLFVPKVQKSKLIEICRYYNLEEDGDEEGALEHRMKPVEIDPEKGSATGYIAKYISKNIDGEGLDEGVYGENPQSAAARVDAWASCWSIRQFEQIGGASVTVWRELRRLTKKPEIVDDFFEKLRAAADSSNWQTYTKLMGGVFVKRNEQTIKTHYEEAIDSRTGTSKLSYFDDEIITRIKGVIYKGTRIITRVFEWRVERTKQKPRSYLEFCQ